MEQQVETVARFPPKLKFLFDPSRYKVLYGGRGGAKSWGVARALLILGMQQRLLILCTREFQNSIADSVHKLLSEQIEDLNLGSFYTAQKDTIIGANGTEFIFKGLRHNINSIKSFEGVDIVWCEEAHTISKTSWATLIPTIRKDTSEIWITFNPLLSTDETFQRFVTNPPSTAVVKKINWADNPWFPEVLRREMEDLKVKDRDSWLNVWEGHCRVTLTGAIYAKEIRDAMETGRIQHVPYDKMVPVHTFWDLGFFDSTAILFAQMCGFEIHIIDYLEVQQTTVDDIVKVLQSKGYVYGDDWLPHDAQAKTLAAGGRTIEQLLRALNRKVRIVPKLAIADGINAARMMFPNCYFDENTCADALQALRHYRYDVDDETGMFSKTPLHDQYSHCADAFRYMAISLKEKKESGLKLKPPPEQRPNYWGERSSVRSTGWMGT